MFCLVGKEQSKQSPAVLSELVPAAWTDRAWGDSRGQRCRRLVSAAGISLSVNVVTCGTGCVMDGKRCLSLLAADYCGCDKQGLEGGGDSPPSTRLS